MGSTSVLDLSPLEQPIAGESPVGEDLRQDLSPTPIYYALKDARSAARAAERQGEFEPVIGPAEAAAWRPVLELGSEVLTSRTKDLEVCAWMIEALLRTDGFAGLRDGFRLARHLVESFWDELYPQPDEDGLETKVAPLTGLNGAGAQGTLSAPIARVPITDSRSVPPIATWTCQQAYEMERLDEEARAERLASGAVAMQDVQIAVSETPPQFFADLVEDLEQCLAELAALGSALDERCGADSPPTSSLREALDASLDAVRLIAGHLLPEQGTPVAATEVAPAASPAAAAPGAPGAIATREDAFRALTLVAEYFRSSEPHSPISFLVERAVRWGRLPLPTLLAELIPDETARETYTQLTGVDAFDETDTN